MRGSRLWRGRERPETSPGSGRHLSKGGLISTAEAADLAGVALETILKWMTRADLLA
jgi:hypothetical protein